MYLTRKNVLIIGVDGYIGNALVQRLLKRSDLKIYGIDNFSRRANVEKMNSVSAIPIYSMEDKAKTFDLTSVNGFEFAEYDIVNNDLFREIGYGNYMTNGSFGYGFPFYSTKFDIIINLGHMPSGPFSMRNPIQANNALYNNIIGTNNMMWLLKDNPDCHYITIGTTGEYDHYSNIDIEEGYFRFTHKGRQSEEMIYPRRPGSIYHASKTASTYLIDFLARSWNFGALIFSNLLYMECIPRKLMKVRFIVG